MSIIRSILDTDMYKLTQQQCVLFGRSMGIAYEGVGATYKFINRGGTKFPDRFKTTLEREIQNMASLELSVGEYLWLSRVCPFLKRSYLDYLKGYRFDPSEVKVSCEDGQLSVEIRGPWVRTILWEVPLMAIISELFFEMTGQHPVKGWTERIDEKSEFASENEIFVADFGTRRRFSYDVQNELVSTMASTCWHFVGTSNLHFAHIHGVKPIGTHAHELFMAHGALFGYRLANRNTMQAWANEYQGDLGIALTDTFTVDVFLESFDKYFARLFDGVRHDSGCPLAFADKMIAHYESLGIDPTHKTIVFSDGLDMESALQIKQHCGDRIKCSFGIGTHLTNDVGVKPLNMVIKLTDVDWKGQRFHAVKLSDNPAKATGDALSQIVCKNACGIPFSQEELKNV